MNMILLWISNFMIIIGIIIYLICFLINRKKEIFNDNGFDMAKDLISKYDKINIIEGNNLFSFYNIKRKVVKLSKFDYYSKSVSGGANSLMQSGLSIVSEKNNFVEIIKKIFPTLKILDLLGIMVIIINSVTYSLGDAKICIWIMVLIMIIQYFYNGLLKESYNYINDNLKCKNKVYALKYINTYVLCNDIINIASLIVVLRIIMIIFNIDISF